MATITDLRANYRPQPVKVPQVKPQKPNKPERQPTTNAERERQLHKNRLLTVLIVVALVLAWMVPSIVADAAAEMKAAALSSAQNQLEIVKRENIRLQNELAQEFPADEAYDIAIGQYGMIRAEEDPVILP
ncbi:MAG: hypothetical protein FWG82_02640 [Oscillospiraceae bacterium]|nr:hypothetical protein [Oscillospiraceae bacterium]